MSRRLFPRLADLTRGLLPRLLLAAMLGGGATSASAFGLLSLPGIYIPQTYYKFGAVYTRAIVPGPNNRPVYVEYDSSGREAREIGEALGAYERAQVMPAASFRALVQRLAEVRQQHPESRVMTAQQYRGTSFRTVDGKAIDKPELMGITKTVVVRPDTQLFSAQGKDLILLELSIKDGVTVSSSSQSLLLSEAGDLLHQTANTIGLRVGFFGQDGRVADTLRRKPDDKIYGALPGVPVTLGGFITGGYAVTDNDGKYRMNYFLPACPGFYFEYTTPAYLELQYKRFNPRGGSYMPYYLTKIDYDSCNGLGVWSLAATFVTLTAATPMKSAMDFPIDLMVLDGAAKVRNATLGEKTEYRSETAERGRYLQQRYDFDGDETPDYVVPGKKVTREIDGEQKTVFVTTPLEQAELQGIYLSSRHEGVPSDTEETAPDFTRLIDTAPDFQDRGLLKTISKDDLRDTDIYVFRESNGQLVAERRGLHEDELYKNYSGVDEQDGAFRYTIQLRGSVENYYALSTYRGEANFTRWQSAGGFKEEFQRRTANHLKAGEVVRIIAINRPTGYMGSVKLQLQSATASGNLLNFPGQRIEMGPPNLKVWAERRNKIEAGMTRGEEKKHLIGNEGAGLGSDISIAIYSDWIDQDGSPLPEELGDYGYTGRLAKIVAANQLAPVGANNLSQFAIKPGRQVQVIHLPEKVLAKQHLYLQVAGQPSNRNPDFSSNGQASGLLKYRPTHYVPVKVPLHDEEASELSRQAYRKAEKDNPDLELKKPEPLYAWQYRPELQFSLYELNVKEVRKIDAKERIDLIYQDKKPTIASSDQLLEFFYDLLKPEVGELEAWSYTGGKELVLAVGEEEVKVTFGRDQALKFENLEHLAFLDVDDFLAVRLYSNNDQGNTLLEWAFEYLSVFPNADDEINDRGEYYYVSADHPQVEMMAILAGYYTRKESAKKPETVVWSVDGAGSMSPQVTTSDDTGIFTSKVTMPTSAGSRGRVYATLRDGDAKAYYKEIIVVPGEAAQITASFSGGLFSGGIGELVADIVVTDRYGNEVLQGASADFAIEGQGRLLKDGASLISGRARAVIQGARNPGSDNYLVVRVNGIEKKFSYNVGSFRAKPEVKDVYENTEVALSFSLEGLDIKNFKPENFQVEVDKGLLLDSVGKIENNKLIYRWHTGYVPGNATVSFSDGTGDRSVQAYKVLPDLNGRFVNKKSVALVVGARSGELSYRRMNGELLQVPVLHTDDLIIKGQPGESIEIKLGNFANPNKETLVSLTPSDMERGHFVQGGRLIALSTGFRYQLSAFDNLPAALNYKGYPLVLQGTEALEQAASEGGIDISLTYELAKAGHLFSWKDLFVLEQLDNELVITYKSADGQFKEHKVELPGALAPRELRLTIQGRRLDYQLGERTGFVELDEGVIASAERDIRILATQGALLRQLHVSKRGAEPLLQVNGSSQNQLITLDENGRGNLRVTSVTTSLGGPVRQVPLLVADNQVTIALYEENAALSLLTPILELKGVNLDDVRAVLGRDVRSVSAISPQVALASNILQSSVADNSKAAALFDVFTSLPEGRHLIPHRQVMIEFLKGQLPSEFISGYIDELHSVILQRQSSGLSEGYKRMVGVLVMSEMIAANSASLDLVYQSVRDAKDLQLWLDWMAMPANGWALFQPPTPDVEQSCTSNVEYVLDDALKVPVNPCRLNGAQFGEWLSDFATISPDFASDPGALREQLSTIYESLASSNYEIRTSLFGGNQQVVTAWDPTSLLIQKSHAALPLAAPIILRLMVRVAMKLAVKLGKNAARNLVKFALGKSNYRVHPMVFLLAAGYLYDQIESEALKTENSDARAKFWSTLALFAGRLALENGGDGVINIEETLQEEGGYNCRIFNFSHGNMYEIVMIAFYQAMGKKIVELDRPVKVPLYGRHELIRKPDIELKGSSANVWIELKSVQAAPSYRGDDQQLPRKDEFLKRFPAFNAAKRFAIERGDLEEKRSGSNEYHKQFVLDRIAAYGLDSDGERIGLAGGMHWRFQKWKPKLIRYKRPVAGKKVAGNGYPMTTGVRGESGTYLGLLKEHFAKPPIEERDFRKLLGLDSKGVKQRAFETTQIPAIFRDPVAQDLLDTLDDLDDYFIREVMGRMGYSSEQMQQIKRYVDSLDAIQERIEAVESWVDKVKAVFHLDIEDEVMEIIQEKGEEIAEKVGFGGSCESAY